MQSPGIRTLVERYAEAVRTGDLDTVASLIDDQDEVLVIGTDPEEWWKGRETVLGVYRAQQAEMGDTVGISTLDLETASEIGEAGWFAGRIRLQVPTGELPLRVSGTARRRGEEWKIVHMHVSVGAENWATTGLDLPTSP
jgi:ketosteroid isomerase-like protein